MKPFLVSSEDRCHPTAEERNHYFWVEEESSEWGETERSREAGRARRERPRNLVEGAPPPVRYQSTAESRTHARITAQGLPSREASRGGLLPTSAQAQRLPISPPHSGSNRRGQLLHPLVATTGAAAQESACEPCRFAHGGGASGARSRPGARREGAGPLEWKASAPPPCAHAAAGVRLLRTSPLAPFSGAVGFLVL